MSFLKVVLILFFATLSIHVGAQQKVLIDQDGRDVTSEVLMVFSIPDTTISYMNYSELSAVDTNGRIQLRCQSYVPIELSYRNFLNTDTLVFYAIEQDIQEVMVRTKAIRKESNDSMHVVDFHFIDTAIYTIQKSIYNPRVKYICTNGECLEIDKRSKLYYKNIGGYQVVEIKDSVFLFDGKSIYPYEQKRRFKDKFGGYLGDYQDRYLFKNEFFYTLIDEYVYYDLNDQRYTSIYLTKDSSTFFFIACHFLDIKVNKTFLRYRHPHPNAGRIFGNPDEFQFTAIDKNTGQIFKQLEASIDFKKKILPVCETSRSEAYLLDSMLYVFDFNEKTIRVFHHEQEMANYELGLGDEWYTNQFSIDEVQKKAYFIFRKNGRRTFYRIDLNTGETKWLKSPDAFSNYYHWEVSNGRLYFISNENKTDWQRVFYSFVVGDPRL